MRLGYLHLPRFPVQRRVVERPSLEGQPLLLHADERGSQRVVFASGAALRRGLCVGQTLAAASAMEPDAVRLPYAPAAEAAALHALGEGLLPLTPGFQVDGPEGLWLDASAAHLSGGEAGWARRVLAVVAGAGLRGRCALASERFTSRAISRWTEEGEVFLIPPGASGNALAPLPLEALEAHWLGEGVTESLRTLGVSTLGEVAALSPGALVARFGAVGRLAARLGRGDDDSCFVADALPQQLLESARLDWPAEQLEPLLFVVKMVVDRLALRLQGRQQAAVRLLATLELDGARGPDATRALPLVLARPTAQAKLLLELLRHQLAELVVDRPIGAFSLEVQEACADPGRQLMLGDAPAGDAALEVVLSKLQSALGPDALFSAEALPRHRPERGWRPTAFKPPDAGRVSDLWGVLEAESWSLGNPSTGGPQEPGAQGDPLLQSGGARPSRLFREPSVLQAEVSEAGALHWVTLLGRRRRVEAVWGPERLVGEWWADDSFARDYYRVRLEGVGELWVFRDGRDGRFFAQGIFD